MKISMAKTCAGVAHFWINKPMLQTNRSLFHLWAPCCKSLYPFSPARRTARKELKMTPYRPSNAHCDCMEYLVFHGSRSLGKASYGFTKATIWFSLWKIWRFLIMQSFWPMGLSLCTNHHKPGFCQKTKTNELIRTSQLPSRKFAAHSLHSIVFSAFYDMDKLDARSGYPQSQRRNQL